MPSPAWVSERLRLPPGAAVVWLWRLRLADDQPISVMVNYLPAGRVPGLADRGLRHESLYDELRQVYRLYPARTEDEVEAQLATDDEAALLNVPPRSPILEIRRITYLADDTPLEVSVARSRGDRYRYRATAVDWSPAARRGEP
jgi:GntR family transcriptional regulator